MKSFHLNILILWKISVGPDNLLISKAFSTPFFIEHTKHVRGFFLLTLHFILKREPCPWESFTWLILLAGFTKQREDRLGPRWTVCNVVSYS